MTRVVWCTVKEHFCDRVKENVALEVQVVYPADIMPDQPPRVIGHRCSFGLSCNQLDAPACHWAGTLPGYDPF
jgi:hypothetical protein